MGRKPRVEVAGGIHHVTSVGSRRLLLFADDEDRRTFLRELERAVGESGWHCLAVCLLGNHYHLLVETPQPNLGKGMQQLLGNYVTSFHMRHGTEGALVLRRYYGGLVESEAHLLCALRYIALNPVNAAMVSDPADYPWSNHRELLAGRSGPLAAADRVEELLEGWGGKHGERYRSLLAPAGRLGTWADATSPLPPRPTLDELLATYLPDEAMRIARWKFGYRLHEIAYATGFSEATVSRWTRPGKPSTPR
jgi:REP element-mobilizing transposase RayT